jgi:DNA-binding Xre family transcriptional regulator
MALTVDLSPRVGQESCSWPVVAADVGPWPHEDVAPQNETRLQRVVREALDRLQKEAIDRGEKFSVRALEDKHDIAQGTLGKLKKGVRGNLEMPTLDRVSAALGVEPDVLLGKKEPASSKKPAAIPAPTPSPPPTAIAPTTVVDDDTAYLLDQAWDSTENRFSDGEAVKAFRAAYGRLSGTGADPVARVRGWLKVAARLRQQGKEATPEAMLSEIMGLAEERQAELTAQANAEADVEAEAHGIRSPKGPSAQAKAMQENRKRRSR